MHVKYDLVFERVQGKGVSYEVVSLAFYLDVKSKMEKFSNGTFGFAICQNLVNVAPQPLISDYLDKQLSPEIEK